MLMVGKSGFLDFKILILEFEIFVFRIDNRRKKIKTSNFEIQKDNMACKNRYK